MIGRQFDSGRCFDWSMISQQYYWPNATAGWLSGKVLALHSWGRRFKSNKTFTIDGHFRHSLLGSISWTYQRNSCPPEVARLHYLIVFILLLIFTHTDTLPRREITISLQLMGVHRNSFNTKQLSVPITLNVGLKINILITVVDSRQKDDCFDFIRF